MGRYMIIEVGVDHITAIEYRCEQPEDEVKYVQSFATWKELLNELCLWLNGYMWVTVRSK